jgi:hypothetical protein
MQLPSLTVRSRVRRLAALGALATAIFPQQAQAQEFVGSAGTYVSFVFGERFGVGWGFEGGFSYLLEGADSCGSGQRGGLGFTTQLGGIDGDTFRAVAAVHGGANVVDGDAAPVIDGEAGVALHVNEELGVGIHTALNVDIPFTPVSAWTNFIRAEWLLDEYSVGGGVVLPGRFGMSQDTCVIGRPLRAAGQLVDPGQACVSEPYAASPSNVDEVVARAWAEDAQAEAASVPAFLLLAQELLQLGAPMALVDAALDAAEDEIRHAQSCAAIASQLCGALVVPRIPVTPRRQLLGREDGLTRLAIESWLDGCLNEGGASSRAAEAARGARYQAVRHVLGGVARDEARHAKLGWEVLRFALQAGGSSVRDAVADYRAEPVVFSRALDDKAAPWGQLSQSKSEAINAAVGLAARRKLEHLLSA